MIGCIRRLFMCNMRLTVHIYLNNFRSIFSHSKTKCLWYHGGVEKRVRSKLMYHNVMTVFVKGLDRDQFSVNR